MQLRISRYAVDAYEAHGGQLIAYVDDTLARSPHCRRFIGGQPLEVMYRNHRHHHGFVLAVMRLGAWPLLEALTPWVYATYLAQGFSPTYFLAEFEAWRRALDVNLDAPFATELMTVYRWFEDMHLRHLETAGRGRPDEVVVDAAWQARLPEMIEYLTRGQATPVLRMAEAEVRDPESLLAFYVGALGPAMHEIGRQWAMGRLSVAHEHLATGAALRALAHWQPLVRGGARTRGRAVVTAAPQELHAIGAAMLADALAVDGWTVYQLGADTPRHALAALCRELQPELVVMSVTMPFNLLGARRAIDALRTASGAPDCRILVGGQAFAGMPDLWRQTGADRFAATLYEGVRVARALEAAPVM